LEPISYFQAIILGALQGIAEPFPISSLGHSVIAPALFGWNIHQNDNYFLAFLVATHCATALVLFLYFLDDWKRILAGLWRSVRGHSNPDDQDARLGWVIVIGTIPAGILGLALEHALRTLFASPTAAAIFLTVNGVLLLLFERYRRRPPMRDEDEGDAAADSRIARMSFRQAAAIGTAQAAALIPGISRSGVTMGGGLLTGLSNEDAARYAFLLATPIIAAAGLLKLPELMGSAGDGVRGQALAGAIAAGLTTWIAVKFLLRFFESNRLTPFGIYCVVAGVVCTLIFAL
jgi:undecaprenyl-diphosphatase